MLLQGVWASEIGSNADWAATLWSYAWKHPWAEKHRWSVPWDAHKQYRPPRPDPDERSQGFQAGCAKVSPLSAILWFDPHAWGRPRDRSLSSIEPRVGFQRCTPDAPRGARCVYTRRLDTLPQVSLFPHAGPLRTDLLRVDNRNCSGWHRGCHKYLAQNAPAALRKCSIAFRVRWVQPSQSFFLDVSRHRHSSNEVLKGGDTLLSIARPFIGRLKQRERIFNELLFPLWELIFVEMMTSTDFCLGCRTAEDFKN